jgi:hypothetical protein
MAHWSASKIADQYGWHWIRQAASGKVPGAYQPSGQGGKWLFDSNVFDKWFKSTNKGVASWPGYINAEKPTGRVCKEITRNRSSLETTDKVVANRRFKEWFGRLEATAWGERPRIPFKEAMTQFSAQHFPTLKPKSAQRRRTGVA